MGVAEVGVPPRDCARAVIGADVRRGAVWPNRESGSFGNLADLVDWPGIAGSLLVVDHGRVFIELVSRRGILDVHGVQRETTPEDRLLQRMPRQAKTGLKIVLIGLVQRRSRVHDSAPQPADAVDGVRVEVARLLPLGVVAALDAIANAKVQRQIGRDLPIVLKIQTVDQGAGKPRSQLSGVLCLAHRAEEEAREVVSGTWHDVAARLEAGGHARQPKSSTWA